ncbi:ABC transporter ATP-binding protein [Desulforamulus ferrireducens]|uniref:ABC transporter ATP-binding protein n=1 Tax=Desulforamulus ferrireducens TaxID=1833852 RepID=UPI001EE3E5FE|nr:ATP-binding cassette domain-containing protein [Desulforamulus ferrireducens]
MAEARAEALALLPTFGLEKFAHSYPYMLSGGMKQRAAFLRTYLCHKDLMLLDEPFGKLDALTRRQMQGWLLEMWQRFNQAVLFVTHDVDEAILLSDRIFLMSPSPGRILLEMKITLPRPRQPRMVTERAFTEIKQELLQWLEKSI